MKIIISPGHGGSDLGARYAYVNEKDINLSIGLFLEYELRSFGFHPIMIRSCDKDVSLGARVKIANDNDADLFLSIHCDAHENLRSHGSTSFRYEFSGLNTLKLARLFDQQFKISFPERRSRGVKIKNFYVLRKTTMPAILFECGFLSNIPDQVFLKKPENQKALAVMFRKAIIKYKKFLED